MLAPVGTNVNVIRSQHASGATYASTSSTMFSGGAVTRFSRLATMFLQARSCCSASASFLVACLASAARCSLLAGSATPGLHAAAARTTSASSAPSRARTGTRRTMQPGYRRVPAGPQRAGDTIRPMRPLADTDVVIVEAARSPLGRRNGGLATVHPADLLATVLSATIERSGIDPTAVGQAV